MQLNLSTAVKPENLKELGAMRLLEQARRNSSSTTRNSLQDAAVGSGRLAEFEAETIN